MSVKQLSVFLENRPGVLLEFTELLEKNNINMKTMSIAETKDFGIVRFITDDPLKTVNVLRDASCITQMTDVIVAEIANVPGSLNALLKVLSEADINVQYAYTFTISKENKAYIVIKTKDEEISSATLTSNGIRILDNDEVIAL